MDNKVYASLKNGELLVFKRAFCKNLIANKTCSISTNRINLNFEAVWNYENFTTKTVAKHPFDSMIVISGKLWCCFENTISVINPITLNIEVRINSFRI